MNSHARENVVKRARIGFVSSHPIQYFTSLYAAVNRTTDMEAVPIFASVHGLRPAQDPGFGLVFKWDIDLLAGFEPVFLPGAEKRTLKPGLLGLIAPQVWSQVRKGGFDALIVDGHHLAVCHIAWAAAKSISIPVFTRNDNHLGLRRSNLRKVLRNRLHPHIYARFDGVLAVGSANRAYYRAMKVPEHKISLVPFAVDNDRLIRASSMGLDERLQYRRNLGLSPDRPAVLYASKFQARKHADDLIRATQRLAAEGLDFDLVVAGGG